MIFLNQVMMIATMNSGFNIGGYWNKKHKPLTVKDLFDDAINYDDVISQLKEIQDKCDKVL